MVIASHRAVKSATDVCISYGDSLLAQKRSFKYLTVIVDETLSWNSHMSYVYPKLKLLNRISSFLDPTTLLKTLSLWAAPFWFLTDLGCENSGGFYMQSLLTFLTMVTHWWRSLSNLYALIGQNLTGEFLRKMYAASETCFLIVEADRVLCRQLVMFLTVFFHWICKMNTAAIKILM